MWKFNNVEQMLQHLLPTAHMTAKVKLFTCPVTSEAKVGEYTLEIYGHHLHLTSDDCDAVWHWNPVSDEWRD